MKKNRLLPLAIIVGLVSCSCAFAAGFQSLEQSATLTGLANAGTAVTTDPSVQFYNPAATVFFDHKTMGISGIVVDSHLNYTPTFATNFRGIPITGDTNGAGTTSFIPAIYYVHPYNDRLAFGLGINSPFGLSTEYDATSLARYFATRSSIETINISPSIAFKLSKKLSAGVGLDAQYLKAELDQSFDTGSFLPGAGDASLINKAEDWAYGWNAGLFYQYSDKTKLGLAYHSKMNHDLTGHTNVSSVPGVFALPAAAVLGLQNSTLSTSTVTLPDYLTFSFSHKLKPYWTVMSDLAYIHWGVLNHITFIFNGNNPTLASLPQSTLALNYRDTVRLSIGSEFNMTSRLTLRTGLAFDQSPIVQANREPRLPDTDRVWASIGAGYAVTKNLALNAGYAHIFFDNNTIVSQAKATPVGATTFGALYDGSADVLGAQLNYQFS